MRKSRGGQNTNVDTVLRDLEREFGAKNGGDPSAGLKIELVRLRGRLHKQAQELQRTRSLLELSQRDLGFAERERDELRVKVTNLERVEHTTGADLLAERRKTSELTKKVESLRQNLLSVLGEVEEDQNTATGLQKRCFKLIQQNTALEIKESLLSRQKGWAEARARVLQDEVQNVYLGKHDRVKDVSGESLRQAELHEATDREFAEGVSDSGEEAVVFKLLMPLRYKHKEVVVDFLTHVTHSKGLDLDGFLLSRRVFNQAIRSECIGALGRELYASWALNRRLPPTLAAAGRMLRIKDTDGAFENIGRELAGLLSCQHAKVWAVDRQRGTMWTSVRGAGGGQAKRVCVPLPSGTEPADLAGAGLAAAAFALQRAVNVSDAAADPRSRETAEAAGLEPGSSVLSSLCVPVGAEDDVPVVVQAVNKIQEPSFDAQGDAGAARLVGRVAAELLRVSQQLDQNSAMKRRRAQLLQLMMERLPMDSPAGLLGTMQSALEELFLSREAAVHLVCGLELPPEQQGTEKLQGGNKPWAKHKVSRVAHRGLAGVVGHVARTHQQLAVPAAARQARCPKGHSMQQGVRDEGLCSSCSMARATTWCSCGCPFALCKSCYTDRCSPFDPAVDLPVPEGCVLHTVPVLAGDSCPCVVQFVCPERSTVSPADDGAYHESRPEHVQLLGLLQQFLSRHLGLLRRQGPQALREAARKTAIFRSATTSTTMTVA